MKLRPDEPLEKKRWRTPKLFRSIARVISPETAYFPNMPKQQPCPRHRTLCKLSNKTAGGANYYCPRCQAKILCQSRRAMRCLT